MVIKLSERRRPICNKASFTIKNSAMENSYHFTCKVKSSLFDVWIYTWWQSYYQISINSITYNITPDIQACNYNTCAGVVTMYISFYT